jgi:UDP-N-acetylmuramate dehydrogenase
MSGSWEKASFPGSGGTRVMGPETGAGRPDGIVGALLADHTTIGIGGPAPVVVFPRSTAEVRAFLGEEPEGFLALGAGSNLLVADGGVDRKVMCLKKHMGKVMFAAGGTVVVEGGTMLPRLAVLCALSGLSGFEEMAGIPGTVGGALIMNAGAYGRSIGDAVEWVELVDARGGLHRVEGKDIGFSYRHAVYPVPGIVVRAGFRLKDAATDLVFSVMKDYNERRRASQPWGERTFGSTFIRPEGGASAGKLLEDAGMKGFRVGDAAFSRKHANFIVNLGNATAVDVVRLIARGREAVRALSGTELVPEVKIWGEIHG